MMQVEKTVRRTNAMTARAVYQHLTTHGYDCFLDFESIDSGSFERIILNQIAARAHFVVVLTPSAVERFSESGDWLRREIEYALDNQRNIVPLMFDGFRYSDVQKYLTGKLEALPKYNSLEIPVAYFEEAMNRLENRFLNKPLDVILHPAPTADKQTVAEAKAKVEQQPTVTEESLSAEEWFERGYKRTDDDYDGAIADYSEAIRLHPKFTEAYYNRGFVRYKKGDYDGAIADYSEAIRINPTFVYAYDNRGVAHCEKLDYESAFTDFNEALRLDPQYPNTYLNRGFARYKKLDYESAFTDFNKALRLDPQYVEAYNHRGLVRDATQDYDGAITDFNEAIRINPKFVYAYYNRGITHRKKGDYDGAIADYTEAIRLNPRFIQAYGNRGVVFYNMQDYDHAIADYETALQIDPQHAIVKRYLEDARNTKAKQQK